MQRLIEGVHKFRREEFGRYRELFKQLSREGQNPHTLFITCSDSRVLAELVTNHGKSLRPHIFGNGSSPGRAHECVTTRSSPDR